VEGEPEVRFDLPRSAGLLDLPGAGKKLSLLAAFAEDDAKASDRLTGAVRGFLRQVPLSKNGISSKWRLFTGRHRFEQISGSAK